MAYVPGYERDVFVSYAHVDNEPLPGVDQGWVSVLVQNIQKVIDRKLGRKDACSLWMDWKVSKHEPFAQQIVDAVCKTATLLVILSPGYLKSQWCERELNAFREIISRRGRSGIFVVELEPLGEDRPTEFNELLGYRFWVQAPQKRFPRILGFPRPDGTDQEYYGMIDELCHDLASALKELKGAQTGKPPLGMPCLNATVETIQKSVFLAETTDDLWMDRKSVKDDLDQMGVRVVPRRLYPQDPRGFRSAVMRDLERCDLFVQLLSDAPGRTPDGVPQGYPRLQYELAQEAGKHVLQWRSPTVDPDKIENGAARELLQQPAVCAEPIADFKTKVREMLLSNHRKNERDTKLDRFIFVNTEPEDRQYAETVQRELADLDVKFTLPPEHGDISDRRKFLEQTLSACDGMVLIHGNSPMEWVSFQLLQCRKAMAGRRNRPLKGLAVCQFPPTPKEKPDMGLPDLRVLECGNGSSRQDLHAFLEYLAEAVRS